ncbi:hypothetical protein Mgra_00003401 [Meloidogyne graminicola]|uniref:PRORP domain-containing protein n=1 Tax=Meloidogyne graminicola TaxID=189291 RepID=A0A8S9ZUL7_9BILA|nr:hypothetical protein Mgra_00003401 [Meloidogyne graminicola]
MFVMRLGCHTLFANVAWRSTNRLLLVRKLMQIQEANNQINILPSTSPHLSKHRLLFNKLKIEQTNKKFVDLLEKLYLNNLPLEALNYCYSILSTNLIINEKILLMAAKIVATCHITKNKISSIDSTKLNLISNRIQNELPNYENSINLTVQLLLNASKGDWSKINLINELPDKVECFAILASILIEKGEFELLCSLCSILEPKQKFYQHPILWDTFSNFIFENLDQNKTKLLLKLFMDQLVSLGKTINSVELENIQTIFRSFNGWKLDKASISKETLECSICKNKLPKQQTLNEEQFLTLKTEFREHLDRRLSKRISAAQPKNQRFNQLLDDLIKNDQNSLNNKKPLIVDGLNLARGRFSPNRFPYFNKIITSMIKEGFDPILIISKQPFGNFYEKKTKNLNVKLFSVESQFNSALYLGPNTHILSNDMFIDHIGQTDFSSDLIPLFEIWKESRCISFIPHELNEENNYKLPNPFLTKIQGDSTHGYHIFVKDKENGHKSHVKEEDIYYFIYAIFDFAETNNSNANLTDAALRSLVSLGTRKPKMFINAVHTFLLDNGKKDVENGLAHAAKDVFVALAWKSDKFVNHVVDSLLHKFQPGSTSPPHRFIILTLSEIAQNNLKEFIWTQKRQHTDEKDECIAVDESEISESYADQFETAYDVVINWMTTSKDPKCRANAAECIGKLCLMIDRERILKDLKRLDSLFRSLHKKALNPEEQLAIIMGISNFLQSSSIEESIPIEHYINDLFEMIFPHVCLPADQNDQMKENRSLITMGMKPFLNDDQISIRVKMNLCQLCIALSDNEYVQADEGGEHVIQFLLCNLVNRSDLNLKQRSFQQQQQQMLQTSNDSSSLITQLSIQCAQALYTISNTSKVACELLWPKLFEYVCVEQYSPVITDIFKCLRILCGRIRESSNKLDIYDFDSNSKLPGPFQLFSRLIVFMNSAPQNSQLNARAKESINLFGELIHWFNIKFSENDSPFPKIISHLLESLQKEFSCSNSLEDKNDYFGKEMIFSRVERWQAVILDLLCSLIDSVEDQTWRQNLASAQAKQLSSLFSSSDSSISLSDKAFLMRCLGCTLARIQDPLFIKEHLYFLFRHTQHSSIIERIGCAMATGHCASVLDHTDLVLTELENVSKWEHMKEGKKQTGSSSGYFLFLLKDSLPYGRSVDAEILNLRATIVLSFGYVIFYCPTEGLVLRLQNTVLPFLRQYTANSKESSLREAHLETINLIALSVHPNRIRDYRFESRYECLSYIKEYVNDEKSLDTLTTLIRLRASKATASLVLLEPPLSENEFIDIINVLIQNIFPIYKERSGLKALNQQCLFPNTFYKNNLFNDFDNNKKYYYPYPIGGGTFPSNKTISNAKNSLKDGKLDGKDATKCSTTGEDDSSTVMEATIIQCRNAIANMVKMRPCVKPTVSELLKLFYQYYGSDRDHERARAVDFTVLTLQVYSEKANDCTLGIAKEFSSLSWIIARLCPRLCDSFGFVRLQSLRAIWFAFKLSLLHRGHSPTDTEMVDSSLFNVENFIEIYFGGTQEGRLDSNKCSGAILAISQEVESRLPQSQVQNYIHMLFKMLSDKQGNVSSAAAQLLTNILSYRANLLQKEAEVLLINMLDHLSRTRPEKIQTYTELLNGFTLFSGHHLHLAVQVLLRQSLPYNQTLSEVWEMMARAHFSSIIDFLFERVWIDTNNTCKTPELIEHLNEEKNVENIIKENDKEENELNKGGGGGKYIFNSSHFEIINIGGGSVIKVVSDDTCALVAAIAEVVKKGEPEEELMKRVPKIIAALLILLVSLVDTQYSNVQKNCNADSSAATQSGKKG